MGKISTLMAAGGKECDEKGVSIAGKIVDVLSGRIFNGELKIEQGRIDSIEEITEAPDQYILPGFIDAHIHVESSMLVPSQFARLAAIQGTIACICDPHEIANVLGLAGVEFMLADARHSSFKFFFAAPSCVPATSFETAGAKLGIAETEKLLAMPEIFALAEMMNVPGVLFSDREVLSKLELAFKHGKPVDGHAPGLKGEDAVRYIKAGITTDHECISIEEARHKLNNGMKVLIREGSAARNFDALIPVLDEYPDSVMFCSDDKHPDELMAGHINELVRRAVNLGITPFKVLKAACVNPVKHYNLPVGLLRKGDSADFIVVEDLKQFKIKESYIGGVKVAENGRALHGAFPKDTPNNFKVGEINEADLAVKREGGTIRVIEVLEGELITNSLEIPVPESGYVSCSVESDLLKLVVLNRYQERSKPQVAFVKNMGLKHGAIASSIAHDSHNVIACGTNDPDLSRAINLIVKHKGGIAVVDGNNELALPLPVAGLMSNEDGARVGTLYRDLDCKAKELGASCKAPFMTLSFLALLVIPHLKLSDKGLFDGDKFEFTTLFASKG